MESYLSTSWIEPATATTHQKLMENVATMENAGKCVSYTKQPVRFAISPTLDKHNKNLRIAWASIFFKMSRN
jgi:hypothetical protein